MVDGYALLDQPRSGPENMALDQRMLEVAASEQIPFLRVYRWSEPTLTLGYFQKIADRAQHAASSTLPVVRRATGGGAIVHHHDWTYCVALPDQLTFSQQARGAIGASLPLYDCLHDSAVAWLDQAGFSARKWRQTCGAPTGQLDGKSFLCFERRSCGDVVMEDAKVLGSAQRRLQGALLQHGSLLLASSPHAPSLLGLQELTRARRGANQMLAENARNMAATQAEYTSDGELPIKLESWFCQLTAALRSALGINFHVVESVGSLPFAWRWPQPSKFGERAWTERV